MWTRPVLLAREENPHVRLDLRGVDRQQHPLADTAFETAQDLQTRLAFRGTPRGEHRHVDPPHGQPRQPVSGLDKGKLHRHACQ